MDPVQIDLYDGSAVTLSHTSLLPEKGPSYEELRDRGIGSQVSYKLLDVQGEIDLTTLLSADSVRSGVDFSGGREISQLVGYCVSPENNILPLWALEFHPDVSLLRVTQHNLGRYTTVELEEELQAPEPDEPESNKPKKAVILIDTVSGEYVGHGRSIGEAAVNIPREDSTGVKPARRLSDVLGCELPP